jgi:hypothetical protein
VTDGQINGKQQEKPKTVKEAKTEVEDIPAEVAETDLPEAPIPGEVEAMAEDKPKRKYTRRKKKAETAEA